MATDKKTLSAPGSEVNNKHSASWIPGLKKKSLKSKAKASLLKAGGFSEPSSTMPNQGNPIQQIAVNKQVVTKDQFAHHPKDKPALPARKETERLTLPPFERVDPFGNSSPKDPDKFRNEALRPVTISIDDERPQSRPTAGRTSTSKSSIDGIEPEKTKVVNKPLPPLSMEDSGAIIAVDEKDGYLDVINQYGDTVRLLTLELEEKKKKIEKQEGQLREAAEREKQNLSRITELDKAWKKSTLALSRQQPLSSHKVDDETLKRLYEEIVFNIANWAVEYATSDPITLSAPVVRLLKPLTPDPNAYLCKTRLRQLLLQSLVMRILVKNVLSFNNDVGLVWAGRLSPSLRLIQNELEPHKSHLIPENLKKGSLKPNEVREYSMWKSKSALLMADAGDRSAVYANIDRFVATIREDLHPFVPHWKPEVWKELWDIVKKAVILDEEMSKSRALFTAHYWSEKDMTGMKFEDSYMESAIGLEPARTGMAVELVLAPALTKTGNADGDNFETLSCISKWKVVCTESRKRV